MIRLFTLPAGFLLDLLMGDPRWLYHPVCLIGKLISVLEKGIRKVFPKSEKGELASSICFMDGTSGQALCWKPSGADSCLQPDP